MNEMIPIRKTLRRSLSHNVALCLVVMQLLVSHTVFAQQDGNISSDQNVEGQKAEVRRLVGQLASDKLATRNQAQRRLVQMGPLVLPLLPADRDVDDASTRSILKRIRQALWEAKATASVAESTVTVPPRTTVSELLAAVEQQTGNSMLIRLPANLTGQQIEFSKDSYTFWESIGELERSTSARLSVGDGPLSVHVAAEDEAARPTSLAGPFRTELKSVSLRNVIGRDDVQLLRIGFRLLTEPRLRPLFLTRAGNSLKVTVDRHTAPPYSPAAKVELSLGHSGSQVDFHSDFIVARGTTPQVIDIAGRWRMQLAGGRESFEFPLAQSAAGTRRTRAGVTVGLEQVEQKSDADGPLINVVISVSYLKSGKAFESHRNWLGRNDVHLAVDGAAAKTIAPERMSIELQVDGSAYVRYRFRPGTVQPKRIVFMAPTLITEVDVPVEFKGQAITVDR